MIIGNGQLAQAFKDNELVNTCIFASGVSNSSCSDTKEFERELKLLAGTLEKMGDKKFVYFSSCALSAKEYPKNDYYKHKLKMEEYIKTHSSNYYIFRIPQLFGALKHHNTLINFLYESILNDTPIKLYDEAYRYVIEIEDVRLLVELYLMHSDSCITVDLANPHRYKVIDIVNIFEKLLHKKADYELVHKSDGYILDVSDMISFASEHALDIDFSEDYLYKKLKEKI